MLLNPSLFILQDTVILTWDLHLGVWRLSTDCAHYIAGLPRPSNMDYLRPRLLCLLLMVPPYNEWPLKYIHTLDILYVHVFFFNFKPFQTDVTLMNIKTTLKSFCIVVLANPEG